MANPLHPNPHTGERIGMGWMDYYRLFELYDGDIRKASKAELNQAARYNPNDPATALRIAKRQWDMEHPSQLAGTNE
jgi:hypothetical protein